ncbi:MAG: DUF928 domain-containing protein [Cyanobacteria bacterium J06621_8]
MFFAFLSPSLADGQNSYRPPKGRVREQVRKTGGSRGCKMPLGDVVTLLIPQDHTASTISSHPTFFWHVSEQLSSKLRFTILEAGQKPIYTQELTPEPGIVALKLPNNSNPLEVGKTYRWTVTVICNEEKPSRNLFAQAWIERVPATNIKHHSTSVRVFCTENYAQMGLWYDALHCAHLRYQSGNPRSKKALASFWSLLMEVDLHSLFQ